MSEAVLFLPVDRHGKVRPFRCSECKCQSFECEKYATLNIFDLAFRISLWVLSILLQIPTEKKMMFEECPWPFTLFHDPIKFAKDNATQVTIVWVALCQIYARIEKARAIIP